MKDDSPSVKKRAARNMPLKATHVLKVPVRPFLDCAGKENQIRFLGVVEDACRRQLQIMTSLTQLVNLHVLDLLTVQEPIPKLDHNFLCKFLPICSRSGKHSQADPAIPRIQQTVDRYWPALADHTNLAFRDGLLNSLGNYPVKRFETAISNNIWMHFHKRHLKYLKLLLQDANVELPNKRCYFAFQNSVLYGKPFNLLEESNRTQIVQDLLEQEQRRLPIYPINDLILRSQPEKFLPLMRHMNLLNEKRKRKCFALLPQSGSFIPGFVGLNTVTLRYLALKAKLPVRGVSEKQLWSFVFLISKVETRSSRFRELAETDGVSVCFHMHNPLKVKLCKRKKNAHPLVTSEILRKSIPGTFDLEHPDEKPEISLNKHEWSRLAKRLVGVDPGYHNLLCFVRPVTGGAIKLNYTAGQRRFETHQRIYQNQQSKYLHENSAARQALELLSRTTRHSPELQTYIEYLKVHAKVREELWIHFAHVVFRKMKLNAYCLKRESETKLLKNIQSKFGKQAILAVGDWSETHSNTFRSLAPMPGVSLRRVLARRFPVLNTNEAHSTKCCSTCHEDLVEPEEKRMKKSTPEQGETSIRGLRKCVNTFCAVSYWNRDVNGALNIFENAFSFLKRGEYALKDCGFSAGSNLET